jgi:signal transduction histidine kinase
MNDKTKPYEIGHVLNSILQNAGEVSRSGYTIYVRSQRDGEDCRVEIEDQGPGIRPDHLAKMFTPFFTTKEKGQGLALAGSRKVLRDMGGDITVRSTLGNGAIFTMTTPREYTGKPLSQDPVSTLMKGERFSHLYRE